MSRDTGAGLVVFATGFAAGSIAAAENTGPNVLAVLSEMEPLAQVAVPALVLGAGVFLIQVGWRQLRRWTRDGAAEPDYCPDCLEADGWCRACRDKWQPDMMDWCPDCRHEHPAWSGVNGACAVCGCTK